MKFFLLILILLPFLFHPSLTFAEESSEQPLGKDLSRALGLAESEDKQDFENFIKGLLFLAIDDVNISFGVQKIDMQGRKKNFSESGWKQYQEYVLDRKDKLEKLQTIHDKEEAKFIGGSQRYLDAGDDKNFIAHYNLCYGAYDMYTCYPEKFQLNLVFRGDLKKPDEILIQEWHVSPVTDKN